MAVDALNGAVRPETFERSSPDVERVAKALVACGLDAVLLEVLEKAAVINSLERFDNNRTHAARSLGISVRTLQRKLRLWANETRLKPAIAPPGLNGEYQKRPDFTQWAPSIATTESR